MFRNGIMTLFHNFFVFDKHSYDTFLSGKRPDYKYYFDGDGFDGEKIKNKIK